MPEGSHVTFLDPNAAFKPLLDENLKKYPSLVVERFVLGQAENMTAFADDSIDVVLTSYVFCSVAGTAQAMSEIRRVLAPVIITNIYTVSQIYVTRFYLGRKVDFYGSRSC
jgi:ubiquinone/menaquinone biosynthesis C-methylase UbiE